MAIAQTRNSTTPFAERLVELAWMARKIIGHGKHHAPRQVRRTAPQFAIDEIGKAAKKQPDGGCCANDIEQGEGLAWRLRANRIMAPITPKSPPWKLIPPFQTCRIVIGSARNRPGS
jgi:hypothetical protein